jgi:hypothetical protein
MRLGGEYMANKKLFYDNIAHTASEREKAMHCKLLELMIKAEKPRISDEGLKAEVHKHWNSVALMRSNEINNVLLRDTSTVIKNFEKNYGIKGTPSNVDKIVSTYKNISKDFFGYMAAIDSWTAKESTPQELMSKVIKLNQNIDKINYNFSPVKTHTDFNSIQQAYNNLKRAKFFYTIVLETLDAQNEFRFKQLDAVTEFSIQKFDQKGKVIEGGDYSNLIGLTDDQANAYLKEIAEAKESGMRTRRMRVLLNRFSKYGHQDTALEHTGNGQYVINQFAGKAAEGLNSYEVAKRGVKRLAEVGRVQSKNRLSNGMMLWEKQWIDGLEAMQKNMTVGYNTVYADIPWINHFNALGLSVAGKKELEKRIGSNFLQLDPSKHFDYFVAANIASQVEGRAKCYTHDDQISSVLKEHDVLSLQQEGLGLEYAAHLYKDNAAHTAKLDGRVLGHLSTEAKFGDQRLIDVIMEDAASAASPINGEVVGGKRQLFIADKAVSLNSFTNENALTFVEDQFLGTIRSVGGYEINPETGVSREERVKQFPIKRNMTYTVDWIKQFDTNDEWLKQIGTVHPEYAQKGLFGIKVSSVVDPSVKGANQHSGINNNIYCFFTSLDELQGFVSSTFMQIGERADADSDWQELGGEAGAEVKKRLAAYNITKEGLQEVPHNGSLIADAVTNSTKKGINDSAARMIRKNGYKHAVKFNRLLTKITNRAEMAGSTGSINYENVKPIGLSQFCKDQRTVTSQVTRTVRYRGNGIQERLNEIGKRSKIVLGDKVSFDSKFYTGLTMNQYTSTVEGMKGVANIASCIGNWDQLKKNNKLVSEMKLADGKIEFAYKKGKGVKNVGFLSHKGSGIFATAEEVQEVFNSDDESFYVDSVNAQDYKNMAENMGEKGIAQRMCMGLNEHDGRVGKVLSYKHSKQLTDGDAIHYTRFADIVGLNKTKYEEKIIKAGFGSSDAFADEIWTERYEASRTLMDKALDGKVSYFANYSLKSNSRALPIGEVIHSVAEKHKGSVLSEEEASPKVYDEIDPAFESEDGLRDENYKFIVEQMDLPKDEHIDRNVLTNFERDHKLVYEHIDTGGKKHRIAGQMFQNGNSDGNISAAVLSEVVDYGGITSSGEALIEEEVRFGGRAVQLQNSLDKGMKVITRELDPLDLQKYDSHFIESFAKNGSKSEFELTEDAITKSSKRMSPVVAEDFADYAFTVKEQGQANGQKVSTESTEKLYRAQRRSAGNPGLGDAIRASDNDVDDLLKGGDRVFSGNTVLDLSLGVHGGEHLVNGSEVIKWKSKEAVQGLISHQRLLDAYNNVPDLGKDLIENSSDTDINSNFLSKAKIGSKSVLQHFQERRSYDVEGLSAEMFERLGYFKDEARSQYGIDASADDVREQMMSLIEEKGTRIFSQGYSKRPGFAFLDQHNRTSNSTEGWLSAGDDFDGELAVNALAKYQYTDANKKNQHMDYLEYMMHKVKGQAVDANVEDTFKDNKVLMAQRAAVANKYYTNKVYVGALDDMDKAVTNYDAFTIPDSAFLENRIVGILGTLEKSSAPADHLKTYSGLQTKVNEAYSKASDNHIIVGDIDKYIKGFGDKEQADTYYKSVVLSEMFDKQEMSAMAKYSKLTIDGVNLPLFSLPRIADVGLEQAAADTTIRQHVVHDFADAMEQEVIFPKKDKDIRSIANKAERFKNTLTAALGSSGQESDSFGLRNWTDGYLGKIEPTVSLKERYDFEKRPQMVDTFLESIGGLNREGLNNLQQSENIGRYKVDTSHKYPQDALVYTEHDDPSEARVLKRLNQTSPEIGIDALRRDEAVSDTASTVRKAINGAIANLKRTPPKELLSDSKQLLSKIRHQMGESGVTAKSLAFTAVGLAESVMVAGFVGGNPSKPAVTHAQDDSEDEYRIPPLNDTNLNNIRGGPKPGYVININAQTNQGQEHASSVIQQALYSGFNNTNINVAMNIHNSGQANAAQISRMLESAFQ